MVFRPVSFARESLSSAVDLRTLRETQHLFVEHLNIPVIAARDIEEGHDRGCSYTAWFWLF